MKLSLAVFTVIAVGCAAPTKFMGDAHIKGGPSQCTEVCKAWNMDLAGMVTSGEFADGCICQVRGKQVSLLEAGSTLLASQSGVRKQQELYEQQQAQASDK